MSITYTELYSKVEKMIKPSRFQHSVDVAKTAAMLAERFGLDKDAALIAGIYHDAYRYVDNPDFDVIRSSGWEIFPEEQMQPMLLHGAVAAMHFDEDAETVPMSYKLAVRHHTLGSVEMGKLGALLYIADYIEPGRKHLTDEDRAIILSEPTLELMIVKIMDMQRPYFEREGIREAETSKALYEFIKKGGEL
ncbi:MAG: bis(5'-nucleosyl)-tetraphosphatase (symmetrical) YqeK [Spirochaetales bacterium]|nr:bis(5'-nucleosyl)-tetraphosphatase (symmetrical) YqeK [Spirochaetales bacterium]